MVLDHINGDSVAGVPFKTVMSTIKAAGRPLELTFHEPVTGDAASFSPRAGTLSDSPARDPFAPPPVQAGAGPFAYATGVILDPGPQAVVPPLNVPSASLFNKRLAPAAQSASIGRGSGEEAVAVPSPRLRFATGTDFDDPVSPGAGSDEEYTVATEEWLGGQMQHFHALQGSTEELDKQLAMFHADIAATPRGRAAQTVERAGDRGGLMTRLQEIYAQHEAEFEAEQVVHLAHVRDPMAL